MRTLGKIEGTVKTTITERGTSKEGNAMYFIHKQPQERPTASSVGLSSIEEQVGMVADSTVAYETTSYSEVVIPRFNQQRRTESHYDSYGDYTGSSSRSSYTYEQQEDVAFEDVDVDVTGRTPEAVRAARRAYREACANRCRKPKNDIERIVRDKLGLNLDAVDRVAEGLSNLFK